MTQQNAIEIDDVQKLFDELMPYEKREFLEKNIRQENLMDMVFDHIMSKIDKTTILRNYFTMDELNNYLTTNK